MAYEIPKFHEQVAAALGSTLGDYITADIIDLPIYKDTALAELEKKVPGITGIPESDPLRSAANRATVYATAIELLPYYKQQILKIDQTPAAKTERFEVDWSELEDIMNAMLWSALEEVSPEYAKDTGIGFVGFRLTFGDGGRCNPCLGFQRR